MRKLSLALFFSGCAVAPLSQTPAGVTPRQWQNQANRECADLLRDGISYEWSAPMVVIRKDGLHKQKRVDIIRAPDAMCQFEWKNHMCICTSYRFDNAGLGYGEPGYRSGFSPQHIEFNACDVLHERGRL
jgi:hypothetical protein